MRLLCLACEGKGCDACDGGWINLTECPMRMLTPDVSTFFELREWAEKGHFPVGGGVADQAAGFMDAVRFARTIDNRIANDEQERRRRLAD